MSRKTILRLNTGEFQDLRLESAEARQEMKKEWGKGNGLFIIEEQVMRIAYFLMLTVVVRKQTALSKF